MTRRRRIVTQKLYKNFKSMLTSLVTILLLAVISANDFQSGLTVAEAKYIDFNLASQPVVSTEWEMNNTESGGTMKSITMLQQLIRSNTTDNSVEIKFSRPPRRNDKALKFDKGRGKIYSYYYLGRSVLYFILYYLLFYVLYFTAHIFRSMFLHRISPPPGHLVAGQNNYKYHHLVRRSLVESEYDKEEYGPYLLELTAKVLGYIENFRNYLKQGQE